MSIYEVDFRIFTTADWREDFELKDDDVAWDLSGAALSCQLRRKYPVDDEPALVIGTGPGNMVITDAAQGLFSIRVTAAELAELDAGPYLHDCVLTQGAIKTSLWTGRIDVVRGIPQ